MVPFLLEISLRSPVILGHRMMLDGLLIGAARERFGDDAIHDVPLLNSHGLLHASQVLAGTPEMPLVASTTYIQSMIRVLLSNDTTVTSMLNKQPAPSSMSHGSGANSNIESVYVTYNIPKVYFLGVGDVARIRSILLTLVHIGAQAHKGNGEVERSVITEIDADPTLFGIVGRHKGRPMALRPVPKRLTEVLPVNTIGFENMETWHYPYFPGHPKARVELCLVPPLTNGDYFHWDEIRALCH